MADNADMNTKVEVEIKTNAKEVARDMREEGGATKTTAAEMLKLINTVKQADGQKATVTVDAQLGDIPDAGEAVEKASRPARVPIEQDERYQCRPPPEPIRPELPRMPGMPRGPELQRFERLAPPTDLARQDYERWRQQREQYALPLGTSLAAGPGTQPPGAIATSRPGLPPQFAAAIQKDSRQQQLLELAQRDRIAGMSYGQHPAMSEIRQPSGPVPVLVQNWPANHGQPAPAQQKQQERQQQQVKEQFNWHQLSGMVGMVGGPLPGAIATIGATIADAFQSRRGQAPVAYPVPHNPAERAVSGGAGPDRTIVEELRRLGRDFRVGMDRLGQTFRSVTPGARITQLGSLPAGQPGVAETFGAIGALAEAQPLPRSVMYRPGMAPPPVRFQPHDVSAPIQGSQCQAQGGGFGLEDAALTAAANKYLGKMSAAMTRMSIYVAAGVVIAKQGMAMAEREGDIWTNMGTSQAKKHQQSWQG